MFDNYHTDPNSIKLMDSICFKNGHLEAHMLVILRDAAKAVKLSSSKPLEEMTDQDIIDYLTKQGKLEDDPKVIAKHRKQFLKDHS